jgi:hypothetical protein
VNDNVITLFGARVSATEAANMFDENYIDDDQIGLPPPLPPTEQEQALAILIEFLQTAGDQLDNFVFVAKAKHPAEVDTPFTIMYGPITQADFAYNVALLQHHLHAKMLG